MMITHILPSDDISVFAVINNQPKKMADDPFGTWQVVGFRLTILEPLQKLTNASEREVENSKNNC